jgi:hypothetical protein
MFDTFAAILQESEGLRVLFLMLLFAFVIIPALRLTSKAWTAGGVCLTFIRSLFPAPTLKNLLFLFAVSYILSLFSPYFSDVYAAYRDYIRPVYMQSDTSARALMIYEAELQKHVDPYEFQIVKKYTEQTAEKLGCSPLAIYEVAFWECGLNPFIVRRDRVAAGWIQFTTAGLQGFGVSLDDVKAWCKNRDIEKIMALSEKYLVGWANGRQLKTSADVYICVFAPAKIGCSPETTLYDSGAAYYENVGLDGYRQVNTPSGTIVTRRAKWCDGKITADDLRLALEAKKAALIQKYH